ncbi:MULTISPECIES: SDR family oxidoreductase [unclassified Dietzia]|uniref:SDR family oxidoreductase n=2 Tax=Dietzia TaxID=37914 RepID=UPI000D226594|nr:MULTISPECIES: SDR family oxidoreductase [unclassified Dietzia]AVZ39847.1 short-chain dehydrogenase [Dietzia sp. JS16-p6b]QGW25216.1 short-chain dehydrogenase [Dietzia sp. DQ12-45-1b]
MTTTRPRSALVTGAGRGVGREIAEMLAGRGYRVMVTDVDADTAAAAAADLGANASWAAVDVRDHRQIEMARDALVEQTGGLDVWVNNAGVLLTGPAWEQSEEQRRLLIEVNTLGAINGTVAAIDAMRGRGHGCGAGHGGGHTGGHRGGGHIITIASLAGISAVPGEAVYAASKHAVMGFSTSTAIDLRLAGIHDIAISCICPDGIWTPMLHDKLTDPQAALSFSGSLLTPGDVVRAVGAVLDSPRPVTSVPAWRGGLAHLGATFPRLAVAGLPLMAALGRQAQRRLLENPEGQDPAPNRAAR